MQRYLRLFALLAALSVVGMTVTAGDADARAGGGRSMGSRGSRSYSRPVAPPSQAPSRQYAPSPTQQPYQQPFQQPRPAGGFFRSMLGGMAGGFLGGMLFRSLGFGGGYGGGGGIGLFEILLLAGIGYLIYRFVTRKRSSEPYYQDSGRNGQGNVIQMNEYQNQGYGGTQGPSELEEGLSYIRQMDPGFDEQRFNDNVMDIFFKIQGAWMNRDLSSVNGLLTEEMRGIFQRDIDDLKSQGRVNRLENIAVRTVEVSEAWQEEGKDFITALIYANLLDYTTEDATGAVVAGSKTDPVKFEEYWTFTRPVGNNPWRLAAINQK
ncbi:Tim44 domain-containing protein [Geomesophilobacter sediminis]|uniref:Tim44 domain-containing protein n=1 Tax=Geomesophilobacter sediminis TaxID=2798584 RepID=A0A8J7M1I7_9BACT|nr:Tim44 domain-containing protein [Geomesophilobacter sediminis]MBJ6726934.1 Tim44 domain-containing protein [Geomesophilobacter sediminis]